VSIFAQMTKLSLKPKSVRIVWYFWLLSR